METIKLGPAIDDLIAELSAQAGTSSPAATSGLSRDVASLSDAHKPRMSRPLHTDGEYLGSPRENVYGFMESFDDRYYPNWGNIGKVVVGLGIIAAFSWFGITWISNASKPEQTTIPIAATSTPSPTSGIRIVPVLRVELSPTSTATPLPAPTYTPTSTSTPIPLTPTPIVQTAEPGHYLVNRSLMENVWSKESLTVDSIDVLLDGTMRLNYYMRSNCCDDPRQLMQPRGAYLVDNLGMKYEIINGAGGGNAVRGQRVNGWMLFRALQPGATSFYMYYPGFNRLENLEFISPERYTLNEGNYVIGKSGNYRNGNYTITLESVDVLAEGRMKLNMAFLNITDSDVQVSLWRDIYLADSSGRVYEPVYGQGSVFEPGVVIVPKERSRGWMMFPSLLDGQTEATLKSRQWPAATDIRFVLR